jgi:hypothetical protein
MPNCCSMPSSATSFPRKCRHATSEKRGRRISTGISSLTIVLSTLLFLKAAALGQVRGVYSPGSTLTEGGTVPDPGFSYSNQFWCNSANRLKGPNGGTIPITASVAILNDSNSVFYVPRAKFLHANLEFMLAVTWADGSFTARSPLANGPRASAAASGLTNTNFVPLDLGWQLKWADIQTGYSVYAPTGRYVPGATNNLNSGFWTNALQAVQPFTLPRAKPRKSVCSISMRGILCNGALASNPARTTRSIFQCRKSWVSTRAENGRSKLGPRVMGSGRRPGMAA